MNINWNNVEFKEEKRYLSNMYPCEILFSGSYRVKFKFKMFEFDDEIYKSSEHLYMSLKCNNKEYQEIIRHQETPEKAKIESNKLLKKKNIYKEREDWENVKIEAMKLIVFLKFSQNKDLKAKLAKTKYDYIEERNDWKDMFWGTYLGEGENHLGRILMGYRFSILCHKEQMILINIDFFQTLYDKLDKNIKEQYLLKNEINGIIIKSRNEEINLLEQTTMLGIYIEKLNNLSLIDSFEFSFNINQIREGIETYKHSCYN